MRDETVKTLKLDEILEWLGARHGFVIDGEADWTKWHSSVVVKDGDRRVTFEVDDIHQAAARLARERWGQAFRVRGEHEKILGTYLMTDAPRKWSKRLEPIRKVVPVTMVLYAMLMLCIGFGLYKAAASIKPNLVCTDSKERGQHLLEDGYEYLPETSKIHDEHCYRRIESE